MNELFEQHKALVAEFYETAGIQHSKETHHKLIAEEAKEVSEAAQALLKELADLAYVMFGALLQGANEDLPGEVMVALDNTMPLLHLIPEPILDEAFRRVHESNMSKLIDGKLVRDPVTGKILKGPNYKAPDLSDII